MVVTMAMMIMVGGRNGGARLRRRLSWWVR